MKMNVPMHDISNILFLIKGLIEAHRLNMKEGIYDSEDKLFAKTHETLDKVYTQVERVIRITHRLRHLASISDNGNCKPRQISLYEKARDVIGCIKSNGIQSGIEIVNQVPENLPPVRIPPGDLKEILCNLIMNAAEELGGSACEDKRTITLKAYLSHGPGRNTGVALQVADSGPGIPHDRLARIFEPFFTTKKDGGNGLGLFIVKQLVQRNGGTISVQSLEGEGTIFQVEFPPA